MLSIVNVSKFGKETFPACVHVDNTARVQIVEDDDASPICLLLKALKEFSHPPILLNTSFNLKGEPIVSSFDESLGAFLYSDLDLLYAGLYKVSRD